VIVASVGSSTMEPVIEEPVIVGVEVEELVRAGAVNWRS
jgi:hypothetical protein